MKAIKIDRSFVSNITSDNSDRAIVRAILAISKELGLELIAEGVETKKQAVLLLKKGPAWVRVYFWQADACK